MNADPWGRGPKRSRTLENVPGTRKGDKIATTLPSIVSVPKWGSLYYDCYLSPRVGASRCPLGMAGVLMAA